MITLEQHLAEHPLYYNEDEWKTSPWVCKCKWTPSFDPADEFFEGLDDDTITGQHAAHVAATWREAQTVRTREALAILPVRSVIRDAYGGAFEKGELGWWGAGDDFSSKPALPALVLWSPEDGAL